MVRDAPDPPDVQVIEFHPHIKSVHVACALASDMLFAVRALACAIDTALLTIKLVLPLACVALAGLAMKRASAPQARRTFHVAALARYVYLHGVAHMHPPLRGMVGAFA